MWSRLYDKDAYSLPIFILFFFYVWLKSLWMYFIIPICVLRNVSQLDRLFLESFEISGWVMCRLENHGEALVAVSIKITFDFSVSIE